MSVVFSWSRLKPRISSQTINLDELSKLPDGTLGREYKRFLDTNVCYPFKILSSLSELGCCD